MAIFGGKPSFEIEYENPKHTVDRYYFFLSQLMRDNFSYEMEKVEDLYTSSETSSFWGNIEQRKGAQQDKAFQYLGTIGQMIKSLQQILHDLRIMDERFNYYVDSKKGDKSAEIALKSMWIDLVEGGAQNPKSVYGLAQQVGFVTLPDLFFDLTPKGKDGVDKIVDDIESINKVAKNVLKRKLYQYYEWKQQTEKEIATRRIFTLKYLRQHYNVIKLYINWLKPYLRNVQKLQQGESMKHVDIIRASEGAIVDLELMAIKKHARKHIGELSYTYKKYKPVVLIRFHWRARPILEFRADYQRGAAHVGRVNIEFHSTSLTDEQIEEYRRGKDAEDRELLATINASIDAVWDELEARLKEAGEIGKREQEEEDKKKLTRIEQLKRQVLGTIPLPKKGKKKKKPSRQRLYTEQEEKKAAASLAGKELGILYIIFKKAHGMVQW